jgi:hypothetical protein
MERNKTVLKAGDLLTWTDYTEKPPKKFIGIFLRQCGELRNWEGWGDIVVMVGDKEEKWTSWQCEVVTDENR